MSSAVWNKSLEVDRQNPDDNTAGRNLMSESVAVAVFRQTPGDEENEGHRGFQKGRIRVCLGNSSRETVHRP